jgi:hypothetical protein
VNELAHRVYRLFTVRDGSGDNLTQSEATALAELRPVFPPQPGEDSPRNAVYGPEGGWNPVVQRPQPAPL